MVCSWAVFCWGLFDYTAGGGWTCFGGMLFKAELLTLIGRAFQEGKWRGDCEGLPALLSGVGTE